MATRADQLRMTLAEFLSWDDGTDTRYELVDGRVVPMAPPNDAHGTIVMNIGAEIRSRLRPPRRVATGAGILRPNRDDSFYVADLGVTCGPAADTRQYQPEPILIVEVLSPSTEDHDRGRKVPDYREIPSLQEILVVASEQRRIELWRREGDHWRVEDLIGEATVRLTSCTPRSRSRPSTPMSTSKAPISRLPEPPRKPSAGRHWNPACARRPRRAVLQAHRARPTRRAP